MEESPSRSTLEELHDSVVLGSGEGGSPSMIITNELTYKVNIRSVDEVSPSALDSNLVVSSN